MNQPARHTPAPQSAAVRVRLRVRDHPGVLPQICGLLMRRRFRYSALSYGRGRVELDLEPGQRLDQVIKQLQKLYDVQGVELAELQ